MPRLACPFIDWQYGGECEEAAAGEAVMSLRRRFRQLRYFVASRLEKWYKWRGKPNPQWLDRLIAREMADRLIDG